MSSLCRTRESRPTGCARVRRALAAGTPRHKDRWQFQMRVCIFAVVISKDGGRSRVRSASFYVRRYPNARLTEPEESERADEDHLLLCPREEPAVPSMVHDDTAQASVGHMPGEYHSVRRT